MSSPSAGRRQSRRPDQSRARGLRDCSGAAKHSAGGGGDQAGPALTQVLLHTTSSGCTRPVRLPRLRCRTCCMLRSGRIGLVEYYTGEALEETAWFVQTVSEWKEACQCRRAPRLCPLRHDLVGGVPRAHAFLFPASRGGQARGRGQRRGPGGEDKAEGGGMPGGDFDGVEFLLVCLDSSKDDGCARPSSRKPTSRPSRCPRSSS